MKLSCEIVEDLLPLFEDQVCSEQSRRAVSEHLRECETCRRLLENTHSIPELVIQPEKPAADRAAARSFRKIRLRWLASLLAVIILLPVCVMAWGQLRGSGIHFTNLHELYIGNAFLRRLEKGDYENAFRHIDVAGLKEDWLEEWFDEDTMADIEKDGLTQFLDAASLLDEAGGIQEYRYIGIRKDVSSYNLIYSVRIDGEEHQVELTVTDDGVRGFSCEGSFLTDPLAHLAMWSEYLWQYYEGCYFDPETRQYVYSNSG